jgi:hypothetical protein
VQLRREEFALHRPRTLAPDQCAEVTLVFIDLLGRGLFRQPREGRGKLAMKRQVLVDPSREFLGRALLGGAQQDGTAMHGGWRCRHPARAEERQRNAGDHQAGKATEKWHHRLAAAVHRSGFARQLRTGHRWNARTQGISVTTRVLASRAVCIGSQDFSVRYRTDGAGIGPVSARTGFVSVRRRTDGNSRLEQCADASRRA